MVSILDHAVLITADWTSSILYFVMKTQTVKQHSKEIVLSFIANLNFPRTIKLSNARPGSLRLKL